MASTEIVGLPTPRTTLRGRGRESADVTRLLMAGERLILAIKDDGIGFSPTEAKQRGMGLNIMHYRARRIGATLDIRKHSEIGTVVTFSLPAKEMKQS